MGDTVDEWLALPAHSKEHLGLTPGSEQRSYWKRKMRWKQS